MKVITVYRAGNARQDAVKAESDAGGQFTANLDRGWISWAEPDVWERPEAHGLYRYYCPGHNGHVCYYGACDEIRVRDLDGLRELAGPRPDAS